MHHFESVVTKPTDLEDVTPGWNSRRPAFEAQEKYVLFATKNFVMIVFPKIILYDEKTYMY